MELRGLEPLTPHCQGGWRGSAHVRRLTSAQVKTDYGPQSTSAEEPKADRSRRTLALPGQLVEALRAHRVAELEERVAAGSLWQDDDLVFAQPNGKPIERKADWQAWKRLLTEAGVRDVRLHDGRHTAATLLLSEGVHPRVVMEVLGHAQMRTTTDTYSHVMPALGKDAAERMGRALWD